MNETSCVEPDPIKARRTCNIFLLDEAFMMYFYHKNMAKFHFFARKNYYETQSEPMFIPYDQWITVQMSLSQYGGWEYALYDRNGLIFAN